MRKSTFAAGAAAIMAMAFLVSPALQARDSGSSRDREGAAKGSGMMNMGRMSEMMDHCSQMMQGASGRPNEQWRDATPPAGHSSRKNQ